MEPSPSSSASHSSPPSKRTFPRVAHAGAVTWKLKGAPAGQGDTYQGQTLIRPCPTCPGRHPATPSPAPGGTPAT